MNEGETGPISVVISSSPLLEPFALRRFETGNSRVLEMSWFVSF
jgi:hypothetical protein